MRRFLLTLTAALVWVATTDAKGLLIPADKSVPPLAMVNHKVVINIDDQVAITKLEQTFRNHTDRMLEATYIFPVPKGASVNKFTMWVEGKEVAGELLDAPKARQIYTDIVRRTQDPGLLEYMGNNLFKLRVFPIPPRGDQKVTLSFTSVAPADSGLIEFVYPLKNDGKAVATLEEFSVKASIKSQHAVQNVYSPTHAISINRSSDKEVNVAFEKEQGLLDKDFSLFYSLGDKDVGLTGLAHRPISSEDGHFMLLMSPKMELSEKSYIPRDMVLVLDTSGSMAGPKMEQAKKALKLCLDNLKPQDRFALINFSTTVNKYRDELVEANNEHVENAKKWVEKLIPRGGTAIHDALLAGMDYRANDDARTFTMVFFTDGQPTIGETDCDKILKKVQSKNSANTRIFTFGVGETDGINATFLDQLAENTKAIPTFVRPAEDIEVKTSALFKKISHPVLANLKLTVVGDKVGLNEIYPPQLPDLFHGGQVTVIGRYTGNGPVAIKLTGTVGKETKEFVYETTFAAKTGDEKSFVEDLWARRKVGYLLDQIRLNGEKGELVEEVKTLAKKYGIATPYTSYLVVPDNVAVLGGGGGLPRPVPPGRPLALRAGAPGAEPMPLADFARDLDRKGDGKGEGLGKARDDLERRRAEEAEQAAKPANGAAADPNAKDEAKKLKEAQDRMNLFRQAKAALQQGDKDAVQREKLGVELSVQSNNLRNQDRLQQTAQKRAGNRNCLDIGGVWIDDAYDVKMPQVVVKAMSDAYFKILEKQPQMKEVFRLGNFLIYVTPSGTALLIDANNGQDTLTDDEVAKLFVAKK
ncbi:MAG: VWA domain-containing protein [Planctomycetia bacterium]|nr:VWA domain-containing protein [Planctomycetia bacterium]